MARPKKEGLDYFPLDVDIDQDDKIALIEAKYGLEGFAVVIKLLMKIYKNSYFYEWTEKEQLLFSRRINVDINLLNAIVNHCLEWELFNKETYSKYSILTSLGIQKRYLEAIGRRKEIVLNKDYLLVDPNSHLGTSKIRIVYINNDNVRVNVDINEENDNSNPQSKVKESKVKKSKEEKYSIPFSEIIAYLNDHAKTSYKASTKKTKDLITARWNEGFALEDFKTVINKKTAEWINSKEMCKYLRPETLFGTKFESYLNQKEVKQNGSSESIYKGYDFDKEREPDF
ncbi:conserved phage C-terminal domain-containing protein [Neobacillus sp. FSL H8-0543]|uniref:conserved phage C-terminal domain-containing protein n=1 Tax=Neobacillus sp. FSL H8-0543 TaxID=2954672 RepID=UPI0031583392